VSTLKKVMFETHLYIEPESLILYVRDKDKGGKRRTKSTGIKIKAEDLDLILSKDQKAVGSVVRKHRAAIHAAHAEVVQGRVGVGSRLLFEDLYPEWLEEKRPTWRAGTYADKEQKGRIHFIPFFGRLKPDQVDEAAWSRYVSMKRRTQPKLKLKNHRQYLAEFMHYLHRNQLVDRVPRFHNPDGEISPKLVLNRRQAILLQRYASPTLRLQIRMGLLMGMRLSEVMKLQWARIDFKANLIRLRAEDTKTKKARVVPIVGPVRRSLERLHKSRQSEFVFASPVDKSKPVASNKTAWHLACEKVGVDCGFHSLRHTCATRMAGSKISPAHACRILGMSLEIYDKVYCKPSDSDLTKAISEVDWSQSWD
jgi:integrase